MKNLQAVMDEYDGSSFAFGDFNLIPGNIYESVLQAINNNYEFVVKDTLTFFWSFLRRCENAQRY